MFCHERYSLLFSSRKNSTIVSTRARKRWARPEGGESEQVIAYTMIEEADATTGEKMASICGCVCWMGNISDAFAAVPGLIPLCRVLLHTRLRAITCLRSHYPPSRAGLARRAVEQESCASRIAGGEWLSAHA